MENEKQTCSKCGEEKLLTEEFFNFIKDRNKFNTQCRTCVNKIFNDRKKTPKYVAMRKERNKRPEVREKYRQYWLSDNGKAKAKIRKKKYLKTEKAGITRRTYEKNRRLTDVEYKLHDNMRRMVSACLKNGKGGKKLSTILGYNDKQLREHLETTLPEGITWDDYLTGDFHIDHISPKSYYSFETESDPEFIKCWSLRNLRILPGLENEQKSDIFMPELILKYNIEDLLPQSLTEEYNQYKISNKEE
jgi:hypothetical protein